MRDLKSVITCFNILLGAAWPLSAVAATQTFSSGMAELSFLSIFMTLVVSSLSGLTALLHHMKKDLEASGGIKHIKLYVSSKMLGSNLAGLLTLFTTDGRFDANTQASMIIIAAFAGTLLLDKVAATYVNTKGAPDVQ